jgi:hypothetical protein
MYMCKLSFPFHVAKVPRGTSLVKVAFHRPAPLATPEEDAADAQHQCQDNPWQAATDQPGPDSAQYSGNNEYERSAAGDMGERKAGHSTASRLAGFPVHCFLPSRIISGVRHALLHCRNLTEDFLI